MNSNTEQYILSLVILSEHLYLQSLFLLCIFAVRLKYRIVFYMSGIKVLLIIIAFRFSFCTVVLSALFIIINVQVISIHIFAFQSVSRYMVEIIIVDINRRVCIIVYIKVSFIANITNMSVKML